MAKSLTHVSWTMDELGTLKRMWLAGHTAKQIAVFIPRHTIPAMRHRAEMMGLPKRRPRWTAMQRQILQQSADQLINQLAQRFGRTPCAVKNEMLNALYRFSARQRGNAVRDRLVA